MDTSVFEKIPANVVVTAVTKNHPASIIKEVVAAGIKHIAENRVQEARHKFEEIGKCGLEWHLIGHLQTNKARQAVALFDLIESVDSLRLLQTLEAEAGRIGKVQQILLQLNLTGETQKTGFDRFSYKEALKLVPGLSHLRLRGLMTIARDTEDQGEIRRVFHQAKEEFLTLQKIFPVDILSMGMTNDYQIAIAEGATEVRLGRALFGERDYSLKF